MVVLRSKPFRSRETLSNPERDSPPETSPDRFGDASGNTGNLDESPALTSVKELIAAGDRSLDAMLGSIADAARQLTGASGAALAMWKDGAMVCRARSGDTAPALGARLSANTGISGECLRTGKIQHCADSENNPLVDVEVCRSLGLRSIAVLPIRGWGGVSGILEVFSTHPRAFTGPQIAVLQQLAALAERARAKQPHEASPVAPKPPPAMEGTQPAGLLPASDRVGDVALAAAASRLRALVLGGVGLVAISLLALAIWLGWRGAEEANGKLHPATPASVGTPNVSTVTAGPPDQHPPDSDLVWKTNPGGASLLSSGGKPSAGAPVKFAAKVDVVAGKKTPADRSPSLAKLAGKAAAPVAIPHGAPNSQTGLPADSHSGESALAEPPSIAASATSPSDLNTVLSAKASLPGLSTPVSIGVSGGQLVHRVAPVYPVQARLLRLQGTVTLAAMVMEDGTVRDVKVVDGPRALGDAAVEAVKRWRYKPFELDGKPVKNEIRISVEFKFSETNH